jgi:hypothetical protein
MTRAERIALAQKRIVNVLRAHVVATDRTLEQKISDAGPSNQRIEPFILTQAREQLLRAGRVIPVQRGNTRWFHLLETKDHEVNARLQELEPLYNQTQDGDFKVRAGQTLEIAVYKALTASGQIFLGGFRDLEEHNDGTLYSRIEPPTTVSGKTIQKGPLDYVVAQTGSVAGIEVKNYRTWLYPRSSAVRDLLSKCSDIEAVPVRMLNLSGGLIHQTYNQLYPSANSELARNVSDKKLLGYHDVRVGNDPDDRLLKFIGTDLPRLKEKAKPLFLQFHDAHDAYGKGRLSYNDWVKEIMMGNGLWEEHEEHGLEDYM